MNQEKSEKKDIGMNERRKFPRHSEQVNVQLFVYDRNIQLAKFFDFQARTLDVSPGGFRIESPMELAAGSLVGYVLKDGISSHSRSGTGEIRWCKPSKNPDYFESGIVVHP